MEDLKTIGCHSTSQTTYQGATNKPTDRRRWKTRSGGRRFRKNWEPRTSKTSGRIFSLKEAKALEANEMDNGGKPERFLNEVMGCFHNKRKAL